VRLPFVKMEGAGNDFVVLGPDVADRFRGEATPARITRLCDRRRGVGADGILLVTRATGPDADVALRYLNRDGTAAFCGNGTRCGAAYAAAAGLAGTSMRLATSVGTLRARIRDDGVSVEMPAPTRVEPLRLGTGEGAVTAARVVVGVPHVVIVVPDVDAVDVDTEGPAIRRHVGLGPGGANVDWVSVAPDGTLAFRTYERGVEAETLACGSGAVAVAVVVDAEDAAVAVEAGDGRTRRLRTRGGELLAGRREASGTWLDGPARAVFTGSVELPG